MNWQVQVPVPDSWKALASYDRYNFGTSGHPAISEPVDLIAGYKFITHLSVLIVLMSMIPSSNGLLSQDVAPRAGFLFLLVSRLLTR